MKSKLREWRAREGLTLGEVADLTGMSVAMVSRVERGERELLPITKVKFARRLGTPIRDLFEVVPFDDLDKFDRLVAAAQEVAS